MQLFELPDRFTAVALQQYIKFKYMGQLEMRDAHTVKPVTDLLDLACFVQD